MYHFDKEALELMRKIYNEFCLTSNCFEFINPSRLDKMNFIISGNDEKSLQIVRELRGLHSFFSTYKLEMNLCSGNRDPVEFLKRFKEIYPGGMGLLVADNAYYSWLIDDSPQQTFNIGLIRPDFGEDYIQKMVAHQAPEHYALHIRTVKDKKNHLGTSLGCYRKDLKKYEAIAVRNDSIESWVYAAYIYHELKLLYDYTPAFYITENSWTALPPEESFKLFWELGIRPRTPQYATLQDIMVNNSVLFVEPKRFSVSTCSRVNCWQQEQKKGVGDYGFYFFDEDFDELLKSPELNPDDILYDVNNALHFVPYRSEFEEYWDIIQKERDNLHQVQHKLNFEEETEYRRIHGRQKMELLIDQHLDYVKKLFEL